MSSRGFLEWSRQGLPSRDTDERLQDFREFYGEREPEVRAQQGERCMDCGVPFCHQGCPLGNIIPEFNAAIGRDKWRTAYEILASTNNFPEFTGRLCPAPCEASCVLAINDDAVTIEDNEREIIERAFDEGWVVPRPAAQRTGKRVAIVGSGPAGLAAAQQLARAGHDVTVFEKDDRPGGLLRYGIPDFKMEKWVIDRRLEQLDAEGVVFECGVEVGPDLPWHQLTATHDAVLVAIGAGTPRDLGVKGRELEGVHFAMEFLPKQNKLVAGDLVGDPISAKDKHVVILGGGDTGSDCLGTSLRQGAASVTQIELFPAPPEARDPANPWPEWPMVYRTSSSHAEGGERAWARRTTHLEDDGDGHVRRLHSVGVEVVDGQLRDIPGSEESIDCDLLLLAMGFVHPVTKGLVDDLGVTLDDRGNIATDDFATSVSGVYAAGDASRGASLIVWAISDGREAARRIDADLTGEVHLPTRGMDAAFGGR